MNNDNTNNIVINGKINTLIILDWDDTLFPTTWIMKKNVNLNDAKIRQKIINSSLLTELDNILYLFLKKLQEYGKIIIVTNALPIWVKISSSILPKTAKLLKDIKIVSARKNYKQISNNIMDWKKLAFKNEVSREMTKNNINNIISVGDAEYEYYALIDLYKTSKNTKILKSIKLMDDPSHEIILDQLKVLSNSIRDICITKNHLDLKFKEH